MQENMNVTNEESTPVEKTPESIKVEALKHLKDSTVSKEEYDKLLSEYEAAVNDILNGKETPIQGEVLANNEDIPKLQEELYGENHESLTNLEYWEKTLKLRDKIIQKTGNDPSLPYGKKIAPTNEDAQAAERVASTIAGWIKEADGSPEMFNAIYQKNVIDTPLRRR